jgi:hypothetical protein
LLLAFPSLRLQAFSSKRKNNYSKPFKVKNKHFNRSSCLPWLTVLHVGAVPACVRPTSQQEQRAPTAQS